MGPNWEKRVRSRLGHSITSKKEKESKEDAATPIPDYEQSEDKKLERSQLAYFKSLPDSFHSCAVKQGQWQIQTAPDKITVHSSRTNVGGKVSSSTSDMGRETIRWYSFIYAAKSLLSRLPLEDLQLSALDKSALTEIVVKLCPAYEICVLLPSLSKEWYSSFKWSREKVVSVSLFLYIKFLPCPLA